MSDPLQHELFHESTEDALSTVCGALGGFKSVGLELWPEKSADEAGRLLRHCLDPNRSEKLSLEQLLYLLRKGHEVGCHVATHYLCSSVGYQRPAPVTAEDEHAELQRQYIEAVKYMGRLSARLEQGGLRKVV